MAKMKVDTTKEPSKILKDIANEAFPGQDAGSNEFRPEIDGVEFCYIDTGGVWMHAKFSGVQLKIYDRKYHATVRKVMLKNGEIDLDKLVAKHAELRKVRETEGGIAKIMLETQRKRDAELENLRRACGGIEYPDLLKLKDSQGQYVKKYALTLDRLTAGQVAAVMERVGELRKEEKK